MRARLYKLGSDKLYSISQLAHAYKMPESSLLSFINSINCEKGYITLDLRFLKPPELVR